MTVESINNFYGRLAYYQPLQPTVKKELHPQFAIVSDVQENILHAVLQARRITTLYEGLRWLDIKRFGITIYRRFMRDDGKIDIMDMMKADDERRAIQLPSDVITAGMKPNPRN